MSIYKRGRNYWYEILYKGQRFQKSTKQRNFQAARDIESAFRTALAKGDVGITERPKVPTLSNFRQRFIDEIAVKRADHPDTIDFYERKYDGLLRFKPLANAALDRINEEIIARFTAQMVSDDYARSTVNHHLRTLKRALRLAARWKLIPGAPHIELLDGETERDFVLTRAKETDYLKACPEFLCKAAEFVLETGLRRKELIMLRWPDVHWEPTGRARRGYIHVRGTKSKNSTRNLSLTQRARDVLLRQRQISQCEFVFVADTNPTAPASASGLDHAHARVRKAVNLPETFVLHSLRHTFATRLGEAGADAFTIMRIMGHSTITVSQRYVHPTPETMERAFDDFEAAAVVAQEKASKERESSETVPTNFPTVGVPEGQMIQ